MKYMTLRLTKKFKKWTKNIILKQQEELADLQPSVMISSSLMSMCHLLSLIPWSNRRLKSCRISSNIDLQLSKANQWRALNKTEKKFCSSNTLFISWKNLLLKMEIKDRRGQGQADNAPSKQDKMLKSKTKPSTLTKINKFKKFTREMLTVKSTKRD